MSFEGEVWSVVNVYMGILIASHLWSFFRDLCVVPDLMDGVCCNFGLILYMHIMLCQLDNTHGVAESEFLGTILDRIVCYLFINKCKWDVHCWNQVSKAARPPNLSHVEKFFFSCSNKFFVIDFMIWQTESVNSLFHIVIPHANSTHNINARWVGGLYWL